MSPNIGKLCEGHQGQPSDWTHGVHFFKSKYSKKTTLCLLYCIYDL